MPLDTKPRRKTAAPSDKQAWMRLTLEALDTSACAFNRDSGAILWRSAAFDALIPNRPNHLTDLTAQFPALEAALHAPSAHSHLTLARGPDQTPLEAQLTFHAQGHTTLRLEDRAAQAQARLRHLEDREQLLFTSRLLSVGEMATTLAHEINQPIGAAANLLRGATMRLERQTHQAPGQPDDHSALLGALKRATEQILFAGKVIARIREYTHSHTPQRVRVDLVKLLRESASLLDWETEREHIQVTLALPERPLFTLADEVMLQQVFVNLMRNAIDAMRASPKAERRLTLEARRDGPHIEVSVRDTGSGISADFEKNLFVPFVSSKPTGTGIGLHICRSFIELHQGRLWFTRNQDSPGIAFHAALPILQEDEFGITK
jgi:two-component system, LuxR family, sensor kinase FixL